MTTPVTHPVTHTVIDLAEPDPAWPQRADDLASELRGLLGDLLVACHHIGSTSVPGLVAKPIIDLILVVTDLTALTAQSARLQRAGFEVLGPYGLPRRQYFRRDRAGRREVHCHAYASGDPEITRHLAVRDLLRASARERAGYAAEKRRCAAVCVDTAAYCDCKDAYVKALERRALEARS